MTDDAALFAACVGAPAVVVAMAEELEPFLADATSRCANPHVIGGAELHAVELAGRPVLVVRTGIGLVNARALLSGWKQWTLFGVLAVLAIIVGGAVGLVPWLGQIEFGESVSLASQITAARCRCSRCSTERTSFA